MTFEEHREKLKAIQSERLKPENRGLISQQILREKWRQAVLAMMRETFGDIPSCCYLNAVYASSYFPAQCVWWYSAEAKEIREYFKTE